MKTPFFGFVTKHVSGQAGKSKKDKTYLSSSSPAKYSLLWCKITNAQNAFNKYFACLLIVVCISANYAGSSGQQVWVRNWYFSSISGNDTTGDGSPDNPYRSITKLNELFSTSVSSGDSIFFKRGETFSTDKGIVVSRSGADTSSPIWIGAYGTGNKPEISGLKPLTWSLTARDNIWISNETLRMDSINLVTVNNVPVRMGRWPNLSNGNGGYNTIGSATAATVKQTTGAELTGQPSYYVGAEIVYRADRFWTVRGRIHKYSLSTSGNRIFFYAGAGEPSPGKDVSTWGYFIQDDSTTLDQQDEWWYNRSSGKMEIYSADTPRNVAAASSVNLLTFRSAMNYITISDINFNGCDFDGLKLSAGSNIIVQNCVVQNTGRNSIKDAVSYATIINDTLINNLSKAVWVANGGNHALIRNNYIRNCGQLVGHGSEPKEDGVSSFSGEGVYVLDDAATIEYNTILNTGYCGIHFGRYDSIIVRGNYIDTVCNINDDGGGIYTYIGSFDTTNRGRKIVSNIIRHGIGVPFGSGHLVPGAAVAGIYNDKGSNHIIIDSNYVEGFEKGIFLNYGCINDTLRNNVLYNNKRQLQINTRNDNVTKLNYLTKNVCYSAGATQSCLHLYSNDSTDLLNLVGTIDSNFYLRPLADTKFMHKQAVKGGSADITFPVWKSTFASYDNHSSTTLFTYPNPAAHDTCVRVEYNATVLPKSINLAANYRDVFGDTCSQPLMLPPFGAIIICRNK